MERKLRSHLDVLRIIVGKERKNPPSPYTLSELAEETNLSYTTIQQINAEKDLEKKSIGMYVELAEFLGVPVFKVGGSRHGLLEIVEK